MKRMLVILLILALLFAVIVPVSATGNPYPYWQTFVYNGKEYTTITCTYYAWEQVNNTLGIELPKWGNGGQWYDNASAQGYSVGTTPKANSLVVWKATNGNSWGHVAFVTSVNGSSFTYNEGGTANKRANSLGIYEGHSYPDGYTEAPYGFIYLDASSAVSGANVGDDFYAYIITDTDWIHLSAESGNVALSAQNSDTDPKQIWHFVKQNNYNQYMIINEYDGAVLEAAGGGTTDYTNVQTRPSNGSNAQRWVFTYVTTSGIVSMHPVNAVTMAVDVGGGSFTRGNNIQLFTSNGTQAQAFHIYDLSRNGYSYAVPKPEKPTITSAYAVGNMLHIKWTESASTSIFDTNRQYEVTVKDADGNNVEWVNVGNTTEHSCFLPKQGVYTARVTAVTKAYDTTGRYNDGTWAISEPAQVVVQTTPCASVINNNVYLLFDTVMDYESAKSFCESVGGHLAAITSAEEQQLLFQLTQQGHNYYYWIGGTDAENEGSWKWATGETWVYSNWNDGEPNNSEGIEDHMSFIRQDGKWNDCPSNAPNGFICEIEHSAIERAAVSQAHYNGDTYILYDLALPWTVAKEYCESIGGHLVTIADAAENNAVTALIRDGSMPYFWIGGTDAENEGVWQWITGESWSYENWNAGEPNNAAGIEHYAHIFCSADNVGLWNDTVNALANVGFVCEVDASGQNPTTPLCGDVNHDGVVNGKDVTLLRRYLAGGYGVTLN